MVNATDECWLDAAEQLQADTNPSYHRLLLSKFETNSDLQIISYQDSSLTLTFEMISYQDSRLTLTVEMISYQDSRLTLTFEIISSQDSRLTLTVLMILSYMPSRK